MASENSGSTSQDDAKAEDAGPTEPTVVVPVRKLFIFSRKPHFLPFFHGLVCIAIEG